MDTLREESNTGGTERSKRYSEERVYEQPRLTHLGPVDSIVLSGFSGTGDCCCSSVGIS
jgi:hypothetical protein